MTEAGTAVAERWLPEAARVIALVRERGGDDWAAGVAIGLADLVGRERGRTFLANAATDAAALDRRLDASGPGLTSALTGAATIASIARAGSGQRFAYLPAGEGALPFSGLRRMRAFRRFVAKVRDGGGTLLLYLGEEDLAASRQTPSTEPVDGLKLDGCIALGEVGGVAAELGAPLLARVERPAPPPPRAAVDAAAAVEASPTGEEGEPAARTRRRLRVGSLARLLVVPAAALLLWMAWAVAGLGSRPDAAESPSSAAGEPTSAGETATAPAIAPAAEPPADTADREFTAPAARYSVLVGSYMRLSDALSRRAELAEAGGLFYVTPAPVRGRTYYRVLAGVYEDRAEAASAMSDLVADGRKEAVKEWDIRPVRLAYEIGTFPEHSEAERRGRELQAVAVPAYVLRDTAEAPLYRVYAGAFVSGDDAETLGRRLEELETGAELVTRSGIAP